jgi:hypothetical protein
MGPVLLTILLTIALCGAMILCLEIGRVIGVRRMREDPEGADVGVGSLSAAVFSLLGLMLAFAYADASRRFDERRRQIVEEVNDVGTAWLRIALLPAADQPAVRAAFREYLDSRIEVHRDPGDFSDRTASVARTSAAQAEAWKLAVASCSRPEGEPARILLLNAMNKMFDTATSRLSMAHMHPPAMVFILLVVLALASAVLAGIGLGAGKHRKWAHLIAYSILVSATIYLIIDVEFPRRGFARIDSFDRMMVDLRQSMD